MFNLFIEHFDGEKFDSLEDYNREVLRFTNSLEEELGRAERWALQNNKEVFGELGVEIKGIYPEEEADD